MVLFADTRCRFYDQVPQRINMLPEVKKSKMGKQTISVKAVKQARQYAVKTNNTFEDCREIEKWIRDEETIRRRMSIRLRENTSIHQLAGEDQIPTPISLMAFSKNQNLAESFS